MESFGPYRIEGELGRGPSGVVHRARDTAHAGRVVALKVIDARRSADPAFRARFHHDAAVLGAVREPHVVPVHGVGEIGGRLYVDMRLVRGTSLAATLAAGPLDERRAQQIAGQIRSAVESLGRGGFAPRAIAPEDVLLTGEPGGRAEFVQLVGLGLGRPPVDPRTITPPDRLVRAGRRRRRRWPVPVAAGVAAALVAAVTAVAVVAPGGPAGYLATIPAVGGPARDAALAARGTDAVLLTADGDGSVGIWDPDGGGRAAEPITGAQAVRVLPVPLDGGTAVLAVRADTTVALHDLAGAPIGEPIGPAAPEAARPSARFGVVATDGGPVLVKGRTDDEGFAFAVQGLALPGGEPLGPAFPLGAGFDSSVGVVQDGRPVVVQVDDAGSVRSRDLATGEPVGAPSGRSSTQVTLLTVAVRADGVAVAVTAGVDNRVRVTDLRTGTEAAPPLVGHGRPPTGIVTGRIDGRDVVISTAAVTADPAVSETRFWDLGTGAAIGGPLRGHPLSQQVRGIGEVGGRTLLLGTDEQGRVTVWDAAEVLRGAGS